MGALRKLPNDERFHRRLARRRAMDRLFQVIFLLASLIGILALAVLLFDVVRKGIGWLDWEFLTRFPSRFPTSGGHQSRVCRLPMGGGAHRGHRLSHRSGGRHLSRRVRGPEPLDPDHQHQHLKPCRGAVGGLRHLGARGLCARAGPGSERPRGSLTLALLDLADHHHRLTGGDSSVPDSIRRASYALGRDPVADGAPRRTPFGVPRDPDRNHPGISRAIGETAPLLIVGALTFVAFTPLGPMDVLYRPADPDL